MVDHSEKRRDNIAPSVYNLSKPGLLKVLGELEAEIMTLIWENPSERGFTVRDIYEQLYRRRSIAYTTVMTTMARLAKKKLLRAEKVDQAFVYYPNVSEAEFTSQFVGDIIDQLLDNFTGAAITHFAERAEPGQKEVLVNLLQGLVRRQKKRGSRKGSAQ